MQSAWDEVSGDFERKTVVFSVQCSQLINLAPDSINSAWTGQTELTYTARLFYT